MPTEDLKHICFPDSTFVAEIIFVFEFYLQFLEQTDLPTKIYETEFFHKEKRKAAVGWSPNSSFLLLFLEVYHDNFVAIDYLNNHIDNQLYNGDLN